MAVGDAAANPVLTESAAISGRPVAEPRTGEPGRGIALATAQTLCAFFADRAGLSRAQVTSLTHGDSSDPCWTEERDRLLIQSVDALHHTARIPDALWQQIAPVFSDAQALDILLLCGWYHAISFAANGADVALEDGAPRFDDLR